MYCMGLWPIDDPSTGPPSPFRHARGVVYSSKALAGRRKTSRRSQQQKAIHTMLGRSTYKARGPRIAELQKAHPRRVVDRVVTIYEALSHPLLKVLPRLGRRDGEHLWHINHGAVKGQSHQSIQSQRQQEDSWESSSKTYYKRAAGGHSQASHLLCFTPSG